MLLYLVLYNVDNGGGNMRRDNYLAIVNFQLKLEIICNKDCDYIITNELYKQQMDESIKVLNTLKPDIAIFPEMSFNVEYEKDIKRLSKNSLIVFGSTYVGSMNKTKIYQDGKLHEVLKYFPSGSEPMIRFFDSIDIDTFLNKHLKEHEFFVKGHKFYILNCLEYYKVAYFIARDRQFSKDLFGFLVPCSNSNPKVFIEESMAIHNHNENIYSFVCNRIKKDGNYGYGKSYIYGPIQYHEKDWLTEEGILSDAHNCSILKHDSSTPSYSYGFFADPNIISRFGRSDLYINTPINVTVKNLI